MLNANYLRKRLDDVLEVPFDRICMHEFVASAVQAGRRTACAPWTSPRR